MLAPPATKRTAETPAERRRRQEDEAILALLLLVNLDDDGPAAVELWQASAPAEYRGLIDGGDGWSFDSPTQTYHDGDGAPLTTAALKQTTLAVGTAVGLDLADMVTRYYAGDMDAESFLREFGQHVKSLYVGLAGAAAGGVKLLTDDDVTAIEGSVKAGTGLAFALDRLKAFRTAIDDGAPRADTLDAVTRRARMYAQTPNLLYEGVRRAHHIGAGGVGGASAGALTHERNVLGDAEEHCYDTDETEGCVETTALGWRPIGTLPLPGERTCAQFCKCWLEYGPGIANAKGFNPDEPRDDHGRWGEGGGGTAMAEPDREENGNAPPEQTPTTRTKSQIAQQSATRVDKTIQRYAEEHNEPQFAKAVGGLSYDDNEPVDVVAGKGGVVQHGIELKTMVANKASKLTMDRYAQVRKVEWERDKNATFHTCVIDDRKVYDASGAGNHDESQRVYYYRRGIAGSARIEAMYKCKSVGEVKRLMNMPEKDLPPAAQRTDAGVRNGRWKAMVDEGGKGFKNRKTGEIVRPKK